MEFNNKEIINDSDERCPNCGSYYTHIISSYINPNETLDDIFKSHDNGSNNKYKTGPLDFILNISIFIWTMNILIAIIPFLGRLVRKYLIWTTILVIVIGAINEDLKNKDSNLNDNKKNNDKLIRIKYKRIKKTCIFRYKCDACNAVYDIDLSYETSNCPSSYEYDFKDEECLTYNDFNSEELSIILNENNGEPKDGTMVIPLKGDFGGIIYIEDKGYKKRKNVKLKKDN